MSGIRRNEDDMPIAGVYFGERHKAALRRIIAHTANMAILCIGDSETYFGGFRGWLGGMSWALKRMGIPITGTSATLGMVNDNANQMMEHEFFAAYAGGTALTDASVPSSITKYLPLSSVGNLISSYNVALPNRGDYFNLAVPTAVVDGSGNVTGLAIESFNNARDFNGRERMKAWAFCPFHSGLGSFTYRIHGQSGAASYATGTVAQNTGEGFSALELADLAANAGRTSQYIYNSLRGAYRVPLGWLELQPAGKTSIFSAALSHPDRIGFNIHPIHCAGGQGLYSQQPVVQQLYNLNSTTKPYFRMVLACIHAVQDGHDYYMVPWIRHALNDRVAALTDTAAEYAAVLTLLEGYWYAAWQDGMAANEYPGCLGWMPVSDMVGHRISDDDTTDSSATADHCLAGSLLWAAARPTAVVIDHRSRFSLAQFLRVNDGVHLGSTAAVHLHEQANTQAYFMGCLAAGGLPKPQYN